MTGEDLHSHRILESGMPQSIENQGTVLIVEDDRNTAALVAKYLEREGFSTVVVTMADRR